MFTPTRSDDPVPNGCQFNDCSLREAVIASESSPGHDYIDLVGFGSQHFVLQQPIVSPPGDTPQTGDLDITQSVTISGISAADTVIDPNGIDRAFDILDTTGNLTLSGVTIEDGLGRQGVAFHLHGGGIHNHGTLTLLDSTLAGNHAPSGWGGGGLTNAGTGTATLQNVTIIGNILHDDGSGNTGWGGGIENGGTLKLFNVTITRNSAQAGHGGGISNAVGFFLNKGTARLNNTIDGLNTSGGDCAGPITSAGNNLASDGSCGLAAPGDIPSADPLFGPFLYNITGNFFAATLLASSPAVDAGGAPYDPVTDTGCMTTDEVGLTRPQDGNDDGTEICDIGAYERPNTPPTITSVVPTDGKTGVPAGTTVRVIFSEPMDRAATESAFSLVRKDTGGSVFGASFAWNGNEMVFTPLGPLSAGRTYTARVSTAATDSAGAPLEAGKSWEFTIAPVTVYPASAVVMVGSLKAGDATRLRRDDNAYYEVNATAGQLRWYGSFPSVPNDLPNLVVTYKGKNSIACTQRLQLYDWTLSTWRSVDTRNVGSTEVGITSTPPSGDYVSGVARFGELRFRVRCDASGGFFSSGDVMNVKYAAP